MTQLTQGEIAPEFEASTYDGSAVKLSDYRGSKLWIGFYRWATCPLCNYRIHELSARHDEFERAGIKIIGVMQSPAERIAKFAAKRNPPFPVIADPELSLYKQYGVRPRLGGLFHPSVFWTAIKATFTGIFPGAIDGPMAMVPADFLVDPEGVLYSAYYGRAVSDHIPFSAVAEFAADDCLTVPAA